MDFWYKAVQFTLHRQNKTKKNVTIVTDKMKQVNAVIITKDLKVYLANFVQREIKSIDNSSKYCVNTKLINGIEKILASGAGINLRMSSP